MTHVPMYRLTHHARGRMHSRQVDEPEIQEVLASPERYVPDPNHGSYRLERALSRGVLKVWVVKPWPPVGIVVVKSVAWKE